jgi:hypothetical protein
MNVQELKTFMKNQAHLMRHLHGVDDATAKRWTEAEAAVLGLTETSGEKLAKYLRLLQWLTLPTYDSVEAGHEVMSKMCEPGSVIRFIVNIPKPIVERKVRPDGTEYDEVQEYCAYRIHRGHWQRDEHGVFSVFVSHVDFAISPTDLSDARRAAIIELGEKHILEHEKGEQK